MTTLIYCADGNRRFAEIALRHGYKYGAQLPNTVYFPPMFTDQNWRNPDRPGYMAAVQKFRPALATVLDWEREEQLPDVLDWAEEAAQWVTEAVILIPKVVGGVKRLPREICGKQVRLGYAAATTFSGTPVPISEFRDWPVHCLGGGPANQMDLARSLDVQSADGNYIQSMARKYAQFYSPSASRAKNRSWPTLTGAGLLVEWDAPYVAFELTCIAVPMAWNGCTGQQIWSAQLEFLRSIGIEPIAHQERLFTTASFKRCAKCGRELPISEYHRKDRARLRSDCKDCWNFYRAKRYAEKPHSVRPLRTPEQREQHRIATRRQRLAKVLTQK